MPVVGARRALPELEDRAPAAGVVVLDAFLVGVAGLVEEELREIGSGWKTPFSAA